MKNVRPSHNRPLVCLDPGHDNQWYNPSPVVPEYFEGRQMWNLAGYLKKALEDYGIEVRMTKSQVDQALDLVPRGEMSQGADLFISLHSNAATTPAPDWVLAMYQVPDGKPELSEKSREFAAFIAPVAAQVMGVGYQTYAQNSSADRDGNGQLDNYYGVLRGAHRVGTVGVIIEHGFHTNAYCAKWLLEEENLQQLAHEEAKAIAQWFDVSAGEQERWYRVRKSWQDAASQTGAYRIYENAVAACPAGYRVYDWNGAVVFSPETGYSQRQFVTQLQQTIGAAVDGISGPETLSKAPTLSAVKNSRHPAVLPVQKRLYALGYTAVGEADGIAGPLFTAAVKSYQKDNCCVTDGEITAGERTWRCLLELI